jgi:hypothetical protein
VSRRSFLGLSDLTTLKHNRTQKTRMCPFYPGERAKPSNQSIQFKISKVVLSFGWVVRVCMWARQKNGGLTATRAFPVHTCLCLYIYIYICIYIYIYICI